MYPVSSHEPRALWLSGILGILILIYPGIPGSYDPCRFSSTLSTLALKYLWDSDSYLPWNFCFLCTLRSHQPLALWVSRIFGILILICPGVLGSYVPCQFSRTDSTLPLDLTCPWDSNCYLARNSGPYVPCQLSRTLHSLALMYFWDSDSYASCGFWFSRIFGTLSLFYPGGFGCHVPGAAALL